MKLWNFTIRKFLIPNSNHSCLAVISLDSALKEDKNCYSQFFLKKCKYIKKKEVVRHISNDLESSYDDSDDSDEEQIKDMKLMFLKKKKIENVIFENLVFREKF